MGKFLKSPVLEISLMLILIIVGYIAMGLISGGIDTPDD